MKLKTMDIQKFLFTGWCPKMAHNVLRLCDGCEALELSVGATCTKPLLYAVLFFFERGQITKI